VWRREPDRSLGSHAGWPVARIWSPFIYFTTSRDVFFPIVIQDECHSVALRHGSIASFTPSRGEWSSAPRAENRERGSEEKSVLVSFVIILLHG
jgi:hypothetical protein